MWIAERDKVDSDDRAIFIQLPVTSRQVPMRDSETRQVSSHAINVIGLFAFRRNPRDVKHRGGGGGGECGSEGFEIVLCDRRSLQAHNQRNSAACSLAYMIAEKREECIVAAV